MPKNWISIRDSKDNELWEFNHYISKIADLPPKIDLRFCQKSEKSDQNAKCVQSHKVENS